MKTLVCYDVKPKEKPCLKFQSSLKSFFIQLDHLSLTEMFVCRLIGCFCLAVGLYNDINLLWDLLLALVRLWS